MEAVPGLAFDGVSHFYDLGRRGLLQVLEDVSFSIGEGEFVSVVGPSGCGKSTLVAIAGGFQRASRGEVRHRGKNIRGPGADRGVVFQKPALYPWMNVLDNALFGPAARGRASSARSTARQLLSEVGLAQFENYRPYELSGGMQSRLALVRTLVNQPDLLLMDEPFVALDAQTRSEAQEILLSVWQRHKTTVLFVTHDIQEALLLSDRVVVMSRRPGTIITEVTVNLPRPRHFETILEPDFVALHREIRSLLRKESASDSVQA